MDGLVVIEILRGCLIKASHWMSPAPTPASSELVEIILIELAHARPLFLLSSAARVDRDFHDIVNSSKIIKTIIQEHIDSTLTRATPTEDVVIGTPNPLLKRFDVGLVMRDCPTMGEDYPSKTFNLNGNVLAFSYWFRTGPWVEIQLHNDDKKAVPPSCGEMRILDPPQTVELHVRYAAEVGVSEYYREKSQDPIFEEGKSVILVPMLAVAETQAATVQELLDVAKELKKSHPKDWAERRSGPWGSFASVDFSQPQNSAQKTVVSKAQYEELSRFDHPIGYSKIVNS
ncbi:hypothetical protein M409DRAFT_53956 [Zasmidium cellare ATCC 36951]|uniref:Uncharacterized protein n=1 Tax=Zasmidium cellare ATCC 36951 TaxID=1080233 RepID=A0A6A6CNN8_ZASCE|nr:uncharacterized protein M409DRAFT_53956 [Zasmidium cellare ATCC 36951]KAF2167349.1 hypothetical protein M409DRAFT_53956 [Zasmidium cellare ATCC 36951]